MLKESIKSSIFRGQNRLIDFRQLHTCLKGQGNTHFVWFWWYYTKKPKNFGLKSPHHSGFRFAFRRSLRVSSSTEQAVWQCPYLLFSILKMFPTGSDCFHVISDCFDLFFRDLHAFRLESPRNLPSWVKYYGKLESFAKEFRRTKFIAGESHSSVHFFLFFFVLLPHS